MNERELRQAVVSIAHTYLGYSEANGKHRQIIDKYNGHTPLAQGYKVKYTDAWCATFVSFVSIICGLTDIMPTECSCPRMVSLYQQRGRWMEDDGYIPSPGDVVMYDWQDSGIGDCIGTPDHVGIVSEVSGGWMTIIEGNIGDTVGMRRLQVNGRYIRGYCLPDYASKATSEEDEEMSYEQYCEYRKKYDEELEKKAASTWASENARNAILSGLFADGDGDGMLDNPKSYVTREQFAAVLDRAGILVARDCYISRYDELPDWAKPAIRELLNSGMINGGTDDDPDDINMWMSDIKTICVVKRMIESKS